MQLKIIAIYCVNCCTICVYVISTITNEDMVHGGYQQTRHGTNEI